MTDPRQLRGPQDLDRMDLDQMRGLADDVRRFLIGEVSKTGGHIGANLGTVELSIALHKVFDSPSEPLIWDTGHQGYTHKILTGRAGMFPSLNSYGGMNRFLTRSESEHDPIEASHAGTSISVALGMALARNLSEDPAPVVAVIGDGALAEGMALEALNHAAVEKARLVVVLNDNGYAISPGFGGLHEALQATDGRAEQLFRALGVEYVGPVDGHDLEALLESLNTARGHGDVVLVHVKTEKGHGWEPAGDHPFKQHFSFPFDPKSGALRGEVSGPSWPEVAAGVIEEEMARDEAIVAVTPSTLYATGLAQVFEHFPERCFDPGMEEQHALTLTVGLALQGKKPVIAYQSTFLQRAFDQLLHDVCFTNRPTLLLCARSGFAGYDNPTHHGVYDMGWMRALPNLRVLYPKDRFELERMVRDELRHLSGPVAILMPYGPVPSIDESVFGEARSCFQRPQVVQEGRELMVLAVGNKFLEARAAVLELRARGVDAGLVNLRQVKPLCEEALVPLLARAERVVTVEEAVLDGGVGSAVASLVLDRSLSCSMLRVGLPCIFVEPGSNDELCRAFGLDADGILGRIESRWRELEPMPLRSA